ERRRAGDHGKGGRRSGDPAGGHQRRAAGRGEDQRRPPRRAEGAQGPPAGPDAADQLPDFFVGSHAVLAATPPSIMSVTTINASAYCHRCCRSSCCLDSTRASAVAEGFICVTAAWNSSAVNRAGSASRASTLIATGRPAPPS